MKKQDVINTFKKMVKEYNSMSKERAIYMMLLENSEFRKDYTDEINAVNALINDMYYNLRGQSGCMLNMIELFQYNIRTQYKDVIVSDYSTSYSIYPKAYIGTIRYEEMILVDRSGKEIK